MILYRIAREIYAKDLSGKGGAISSARWHNHLPVIYTSVHSSTAILEKLVQLKPSEIHHDLMIMGIVVPDQYSSLELDPGDLPGQWNTYPPLPLLQRIGNAWLLKKSSLLLFVPSVIDQLAMNVLINPGHPEAEKLKIDKVEPFTFDGRLTRKL
ncbi:RES family NAD+ phosphorylase [Pedobacter sp. L105]|uniref:RES family NAD+ phosphorylase n=1 Tax=Pedobacter sp. L105 TaxID=1641871 RepID=UPI00131CEC85|nr:RES domain-containing protein [Pedobacter sp. L105]